MNTGEKVTRYLQERKKPVHMHDIAHHFLLSTSTVGKALRTLEREGKVIRTYQGKTAFWLWNRRAGAMAVSKITHPIQQSEPAPIQRPPVKIPTSYPHIRGYED